MTWARLSDCESGGGVEVEALEIECPEQMIGWQWL